MPAHILPLPRTHTNNLKWDKRFLEMAKLVSTWSKDPSTKCGAVIVRPDRTVASTGYNGFPRNCKDDLKIYENRELKYARVVHAELNAILHVHDQLPLKGYTLYTYPPAYGPSCDRCAAHVAQSGISKIVHIKDDSDFALRWKDACERGLDMLDEAGIEVVSYALEDLFPPPKDVCDKCGGEWDEPHECGACPEWALKGTLYG